ncbi:hypothetical protein MTO96_001900 [Rhipicephalus appendiculatus]
MRTLNWNKIPAHKVLAGGRKSLWRRIAESHTGGESPLDFAHLEGLFCQHQPSQPATSAHHATGSVGGGPSSWRGRRRRRYGQRQRRPRPTRSCVGIFLKQLRGQADEAQLLDVLRRGGGGGGSLGADKLRALQALLPAPESATALETALLEREPGQLAPPEAFLARILRLPDYRLRVESLLLQEELPTIVASLETSMTCLRNAAKEIQDCKALHEVLYMILVAGNFLNSGGYAGNAAGFQVMSLLKVAELRSNRPGVGLLHYVAQEAERAQVLGGGHLGYDSVLPSLEAASRVSGDQVRADVSALAERLARLQGGCVEGGQPPFLRRRLPGAHASAARARPARARATATEPAHSGAGKKRPGFLLLRGSGQLPVGRVLRSHRNLLEELQSCRPGEPQALHRLSPTAASRELPATCRDFAPRMSVVSRLAPARRTPVPRTACGRSFRRSRPSSSEMASDDQLFDFLRHGSDREDSLGRRASRREARRRWAADLSEDSTSRERVPSRETEQTPPPSTPREPATGSSPAADAPSYTPRRSLAKPTSTTATSFATTSSTPSTEFPKSVSRHDASSKSVTLSPPPPITPTSTAPLGTPEATAQVDFSRRTAVPVKRIPPPSAVPAVPAVPTTTPTAQVSFVHSSSPPRRSALPSPTPTSPQPTNVTTPPTTPNIASTVVNSQPSQGSGLPSPTPRITPPLQLTSRVTATSAGDVPYPDDITYPRVTSSPAHSALRNNNTSFRNNSTDDAITYQGDTAASSNIAVNDKHPITTCVASNPADIFQAASPHRRHHPRERKAGVAVLYPQCPEAPCSKRSSRVSPSEKPFMRATSAWTARSGPVPATNGNTPPFGSSAPLITPSSPLFGTHSANVALQRRIPLTPLRDRSAGQRPSRTKTPPENQYIPGSRWRSSRTGMSP